MQAPSWAYVLGLLILAKTNRFWYSAPMPSQHTPEPWTNTGIGLVEANDALVVAITRTHRNGVVDYDANAARIVACVNACKGLSISTLEAIAQSGGGLHSTEEEFQDMLHATRNRVQRDRLIAVCKLILDEHARAPFHESRGNFDASHDILTAVIAAFTP